MARRSRMSMMKRQRESLKAEKAERKRAKRHGLPPRVANPEPTATVSFAEPAAPKPPADDKG